MLLESSQAVLSLGVLREDVGWKMWAALQLEFWRSTLVIKRGESSLVSNKQSCAGCGSYPRMQWSRCCRFGQLDAQTSLVNQRLVPGHLIDWLPFEEGLSGEAPKPANVDVSKTEEAIHSQLVVAERSKGSKIKQAYK